MLRPAGASLFVSGKARIRADELKRKLGDATWYTLLALWTCRSKAGVTTVTNAGLARAEGFARQTLRSVRHATRKLKAAGLLVPIGWRERKIPVGKRVVAREVFLRRVYGAPAEGNLGAEAVVFVPPSTVAWAEKATMHGGARVGAGRPRRGIQDGPTPFQDGPTSPPSEEFKTVPRSYSPLPLRIGPAYPLASLGDAALADVGRGAVSSYGSGGTTTNHSGEPTPLPTSAASGTHDAPSGDLAVVEREVVFCALSAPIPPDPPNSTPNAALGAFLAEGGKQRPKPPVLPTTPIPGLPSAPWLLVGVATVPSPPMLEPDMTSRERAIRLADAYRGATKARFGRDAGFAFRRGDISTSKHYATLTAAAAFMLGHELAPAAWAAWSCDIWKVYNTATKPPPVAWVFGPKRLAERRGWFESEEEGYGGGTVQYGPKQTDLIRRYLSARYAIDAAGVWADPRPLFDRYFPGDAYERAVEAAKREVAAAKEALRRDADMGVFLW